MNEHEASIVANALLGANSSSFVETDSVMTFDTMKSVLHSLDKIPKPPVGIVCAPVLIRWCRDNLMKDENASRAIYGLSGIPVYSSNRIGDAEGFRLFYDYDELRKFLK